MESMDTTNTAVKVHGAKMCRLELFMIKVLTKIPNSACSAGTMCA